MGNKIITTNDSISNQVAELQSQLDNANNEYATLTQTKEENDRKIADMKSKKIALYDGGGEELPIPLSASLDDPVQQFGENSDPQSLKTAYENLYQNYYDIFQEKEAEIERNKTMVQAAENEQINTMITSYQIVDNQNVLLKNQMQNMTTQDIATNRYSSSLAAQNNTFTNVIYYMFVSYYILFCFFTVFLFLNTERNYSFLYKWFLFFFALFLPYLLDVFEQLFMYFFYLATNFILFSTSKRVDFSFWGGITTP